MAFHSWWGILDFCIWSVNWLADHFIHLVFCINFWLAISDYKEEWVHVIVPIAIVIGIWVFSILSGPVSWNRNWGWLSAHWLACAGLLDHFVDGDNFSISLARRFPPEGLDRTTHWVLIAGEDRWRAALADTDVDGWSLLSFALSCLQWWS